jgi:hypothetical protein
MGALALGAAMCLAGLMTASAQQQQDEKHAIKGGIEGKVKSVDADKQTLTITTTQGRDRTFTITDDTTMLGPRGGKVRHRLHDPRFHPGFDVVIVAEGNNATEVHLGFRSGGGPEIAGQPGAERPAKGTRTTPQPTETTPERTTKTIPLPRERGKAAAQAQEEDEDNEIPGQVKRFDPSRRILVISLLNGKDRAFMLSNDVKVLVRGAASRRGLQEPSLKSGAAVEIVTDEGGRKVKEVKIVPASELRGRKAG